MGPRLARTLLCAGLIFSGCSAASADDGAEAWARSLCDNAGSAGEVGLMGLEGAIGVYSAKVAADSQQLLVREGALAALKRQRDALAGEMAQRGGSPAAAAAIIRRDSENSKKAWRDRYQPDIDTLKAAYNTVNQQIGAAMAELSQAQHALATEEAKPWLSRSSDAVANFEQQVAQLNARIATLTAQRAPAAAAVSEKQAELHALLATEDATAQQKVAAQEAQWGELRRRSADYNASIDAQQTAVASLHGSIGRAHQAIPQARQCIANARRALNQPPTASPSPSGDQPSSSGGRRPRTSTKPPADRPQDSRGPMRADLPGEDFGGGLGPAGGSNTGRPAAQSQGAYGASPGTPGPNAQSQSPFGGGYGPLGYPGGSSGTGTARRPDYRELTPGGPGGGGSAGGMGSGSSGGGSSGGGGQGGSHCHQRPDGTTHCGNN